MAPSRSKSGASKASTTSLASTYVQLKDDLSARPVEVTDSFWEELAGGQRPELEAGRLVMQLQMSEDWPTWEVHPAGDELVILVEGEADLVLDREGGEEVVPLRKPGEFVRVPRGVWHTARIRRSGSMIFVTPGKGTLNRPVEARTGKTGR